VAETGDNKNILSTFPKSHIPVLSSKLPSDGVATITFQSMASILPQHPQRAWTINNELNSIQQITNS
jgi:hypothetical protein